MKMRALMAALAALFVGAAVAAGGSSGKADMAELDANGDGVISAEEAQAHPTLAERFESLDENSDQTLDQGEFARFEAAPDESMQE